MHKTNFTSRWAFIIACVGSAIGMANVWGFPYKVGTNGGGLISYEKSDQSAKGEPLAVLLAKIYKTSPSPKTINRRQTRKPSPADEANLRTA